MGSGFNYSIQPTDNPKDVKLWNDRFSDIARRLAGHDEALDAVRGVANRVEGVALDRINTVITPLVLESQAKLRNISEVFYAPSQTSESIGLGAKRFIVDEGYRNGFAAKGWILISPKSNGASGMIGRLQSLDRDSGELLFNSVKAIGEGDYSSWDIFVSPPPDLVHEARRDNPHLVSAAQIGAYTATEVDSNINAVKAALEDELVQGLATLKGAPPGNLNSLEKISAALGGEAAFAAVTADALNNRLRFDQAQVLTVQNKGQALDNLGFSALGKSLGAVPGVSDARTMLQSGVNTGALVSISAPSYDFSLPEGVKSVLLTFASSDGTGGISTSGTSIPRVIPGNETGYIPAGGNKPKFFGGQAVISNTNISSSAVSAQNYLLLDSTWGPTSRRTGHLLLSYIGSSPILGVVHSLWSYSGVFSASNANWMVMLEGSLTLVGALRRLMLTTVNGTDTITPDKGIGISWLF